MTTVTWLYRLKKQVVVFLLRNAFFFRPLGNNVHSILSGYKKLYLFL